MSPSRPPRRVPWAVALPLFALITLLICAEVFAVHVMHDAWKAAVPGRLTRLFLLDFPPVFLTIGLTLWIHAKLLGGGLRHALRESGIMHIDSRQLRVAGISTGAWIAWHLWGAQLLNAELSATRDFSYVLWLAIHTALREELVFRGTIYGVLRSGRTHASAAIVSSLLFALAHVGRSTWYYAVTGEWTLDTAIWQVFHPFFFGLIACSLYDRGNRSLWGVILVHFGWYAFDVFPGRYPGTLRNLDFNAWLSFIGVAVHLGLLVLAIEWLLPSRLRPTPPRRRAPPGA